jgi:hypothetical protein
MANCPDIPVGPKNARSVCSRNPWRNNTKVIGAAASDNPSGTLLATALAYSVRMAHGNCRRRHVFSAPTKPNATPSCMTPAGLGRVQSPSKPRFEAPAGLNDRGEKSHACQPENR